MFELLDKESEVIFSNGNMLTRIAFVTSSIVRVTCTINTEFSQAESRIVVLHPDYQQTKVIDEGGFHKISTKDMQVSLCKETGALTFYDADGGMLTGEPVGGGKWLTRKQLYRYQYGNSVSTSESIDGVKADGVDGIRVPDREAFEAKVEFNFDNDEALFGFGSHEEGYGNLRGRSRELYQQNMKACVPCFVSSKGYGVLFDCSSLMTFHDDAFGSYVWLDAVDELDYYIIGGGSTNAVMRNYYRLTGNPPLLPKWAFGYIQSKERYVNGQELIDIVQEYRRREIPLDAIVLDWQSWPYDGGWGQKEFDKQRFPDAEAIIGRLHDLGAKLMVSIWPIMTGECDNRKEMLENKFMLGNQSTYDAFNPDARNCYWAQAERGLFQYGVDAWWCDCSEPFEADWYGAVKPEPHVRVNINTDQSKKYMDETLINAYSLMHSRGIYEGQRRSTDKKRVVNLTRSSYAGQHRYATITWNGDISATWEVFRRCIPEGVNFCATGEPYWTVDIGAFFIKNNPSQWFWSGDYEDGCRGLTAMGIPGPDPKDTGCTDLGYFELYTRWLQYATFLPMLRSHGTDAPREIWRFGDAGDMFYDSIAKFIKLRYRLIPYIYSVSAQIAEEGMSLVRAVALDYPDDKATYLLANQYLFGPSILVCPVTEPMYYGRHSELLSVTKRWNVYLPAGCDWYGFWNEQRYSGGQSVSTDAGIDTMPLFISAGSILPLGGVMQYTAGDTGDIELRVYSGRDGKFVLYEDEGDNYSYETGACSRITFTWNENEQLLFISARTGKFSGMKDNRNIRVVIISEDARKTIDVAYQGTEMKIPAA